jgi:very-short-patch-repair endonuclease
MDIRNTLDTVIKNSYISKKAYQILKTHFNEEFNFSVGRLDAEKKCELRKIRCTLNNQVMDLTNAVKIVSVSTEYDTNIKAYNKYSLDHPMKYVSYNSRKYVVNLPGTKSISYDNEHSAYNRVLEYLIKTHTENGTIYVQDINEIDNIRYVHEDIIYYDLNHIINLLQVKPGHFSKIYAEYKNSIKRYTVFRNTYGGFILRPLIDIVTVKQIFYGRRTIGIKSFCEANDIDVYDIHIMKKESSTLLCIIQAFSNEEYICQKWIEPYKVDLLFVKYNLIIECDENGHKDRNQEAEKVRYDYIVNKGYSFVRYNPDENHFSIFVVIGQIHDFMMKFIHIDKKLML